MPLLCLAALPPIALFAMVADLYWRGLGGPVWGYAIPAVIACAVSLWSALRLVRAQREARDELIGELARRLGSGDPEKLETEDVDHLGDLGKTLVDLRRRHLRAMSVRLKAESELRALRGDVEKTIEERTSTIAASEESVRLLLEAVPEGIYGIDNSGVCTFCNPACIKLLGYEHESDLVGKPVTEQMPIAVNLTKHSACDGKPIHAQDTFWRGDGTLFPVEYWSFPVTKGDEVVGAVVTFIDITHRKRAELALFREKEHAQVTLKSIADGVITTDSAGNVRYLNPSAEGLLGCSNKEAAGQSIAKVFPILNESTQEPERNLLPNRGWDITKGEHHKPSLLIVGEGTKIFVERSAAPIRDRDGSVIGYIIVFRDVSESRRMARQLAYQATHDALTKTINRREFERRVERVLKDRRTANRECVVCYLDLDQFKVVNDTCGHGAGDELLRQLSQMLRTHVRRRDTLARLGGDEFGILFEQCSLADAYRLANTIREAIHEFRFGWDDKTFSVGVSIGLVEINKDTGTSLAEVLSAADNACYIAKEKGRNRVQIHRPDDNEVKQMQGEVRWVTRIHEALENNRFRLYYQDIVETQADTSRQLGQHVEILMRMVDRDGKIAVPGAFLPAAERYNVIQATDRWVVREVFRWLAQPDRGTFPRTVSINLSGPTISDSTFLDFTLATLDETSVDAGRVCFEITETAAIAKLTNATSLINKLRERGFQFALDDFGSGLSSFGYLKQLPVDYVKIDGTFVKDIVDDPINRAMVRSINDIGQIMGKRTIAEYVESPQILDILRDIGVDYAQGYGISKPKPLELLGGSETRIASSA